MRTKKKGETTLQKGIRLQRERDAKRRRREKESDIDRKTRLEKQKERQRHLRGKENLSQTKNRLDKLKQAIQSQGEEERKRRLHLLRENQKKRIASETENERKRRLKLVRENKKQRIANETENERNRSLQCDRERWKQRIAGETGKERNERLILLQKSQKRLIANETNEKRNRRLNFLRKSQERRIASETEEERNKRLNLLRENQKQRIASETEEEKNRRLNLLRENQKERIAKETEEERNRRLEQLKIGRKIRVDNFSSWIWVFADRICEICKKCCYPRQMTNVKFETLSRHAKNYLPNELKDKLILKMCDRCKRHLINVNKDKHPSRAYWNNLCPGNIPEQLENLTTVERRLLSRIIAYIKVIKFDGRFGQHGFRGQAILFPQDVQEIPEQLFKVLPRPITETGLVIITEELENINVIRQLQINVDRLYRALVWLKINNSLYQDVIIDIPETTFNLNEICRTRLDSLKNNSKNTKNNNNNNISSNKNNWKTLKNNTRIISGHINQGDSIFSEYGGVQCVAMSAAAIVKAHIIPLTFWSSTTVDDILLEGDSYYKRIRQSKELTHSYLLVKELEPTTVMFQKTVKLTFDSDPLYCGNTSGKHFDEESTMLEKLEEFFMQNSYGIFICNGYSRAILKYNHNQREAFKYFLVDSHSCGSSGAPCRQASHRGKACIIETSSINQLAKILKRNIGTEHHDYTIDRITCAILRTSLENQSQPNHAVANVSNSYIPIQSSIMLPIENRQPCVGEVVEIDNNNNNINIDHIRRKTDEPVNVHNEPKAEELSWFFLFPYGISGLDDQRPVRITPLDYFQTRIMGADTRFQRNDYLFYALSVYEFLRAKANINVCCKKVQQNNRIVEDLHLYVKNLRGSGAYWTGALNELLSMIMTLGAPSFFLTFSCNDLNWLDMRKALLLADGKDNVDPASLTINDVQSLIDKYPVVISRHFMIRVNALMRLLTTDRTLFKRKVEDYWWRIEFQNRGSPHLHMVIWIENLPQMDSPDGVNYIDSIISCTVPNHEEDPELNSLVNTAQKHRHSNTCFKKAQHCRFGFPRKTSDITKIINPNTNELISNGGRICILKRKVGEEFINNYHPDILRIWGGNMDIQPCGTATAIAYYVAKYVAKSEPSLLDQTLREVIAKIRDEETSTFQRKIFKMSMALLNQRQVSACECAYRLCHLKFKQSSRKSIFVNTRKPDRRYRVLKLTNNEENEYCMQIFDRYEARPRDLEELSLGEFAITYEPHYDNRNRPDVDNDVGDEDAYDILQNTEQQRLITLINRKGRMEVRSKSAILRTPKFSMTADREAYYYHLLLLHLPFRDEAELLLGYNSAEEAFLARSERLKLKQSSIQEYRRLETELQAALDQIMALMEQESNIYRPNEMEEEIEIRQPSDENIEIEQRKVEMNDQEYKENREKMNIPQQQVFNYITKHIKQEVQSLNPEPLKIFITGGAGTGKTFILNLLSEQIRRCYRPILSNTNETALQIAAPTGVAAQLIHGQTLHSLIKLPVQKDRRQPTWKPLTGIFLEKMRRQWASVRFLIIDEISMVPYELLVYIDLRLKELKNSIELFGGINILLFGDLMQLPPVSGHPIYCQPTSMEGAIHLFRLFEFCELTENMRQRGDLIFINLLNNLREGNLTSEQLNVLVRRAEESKFAGDFVPEKAIRIMPTNKMVRDHNYQVIAKIDESVVTYKIQAYDRLVEDTNKTLSNAPPLDQLTSENINRTAGVPKDLTIYVGLKIMLRYNVNVSIGLCNGSMGEIMRIIWPNLRRGQIYANDIPSTEIEFDNGIGRHIIEPIAVSFEAKFGYGLIERRMLPMVPCYAVTVHKLQGTTVSRAVVNLGKAYFIPGQKFVALSRVSSLAGVEIDDIDPSGLIGENVCNEEALNELIRLRALPKKY